MDEQKHLHYGHRARLRERVKKEGIENFQDYQVLEYVLSFVLPYKDTNPTAHMLINKFGSFDKVLEANIEDIASVKGMGEVSASFLATLRLIFSFYQKQKNNCIDFISNTQETFDYAKNLFAGKRKEEIYVISLLASNKIAGVDKIAEGTINQANCSIRAITDIMASRKVANIILLHNHPEGVAQPSGEDDKITKALVYALAISGSHLTDHMIIAGDEFYSYKMKNKIGEYSNEVSNIIGLSHVKSKPEARYDIGQE